MKEKGQGKWKILIFLSSVTTLSVLFAAIQKLSQDVFKLPIFYTWIVAFCVIFPLALLVAFHKYSQCIFMLTIPQIISKRGRMLLIATAFLVSFSGPTKNLLKNGEILSESLSCSQDQVRLALQNLITTAKEPYRMVQDMVAKMLPVIKRNVERIKQNILDMKRSIEIVAKSIKKAFSWLENIVKVCNEKEGSPFEKCQAALEKSTATCRDKFGVFSFLCETTKLIQMFCYALKPIEYFCEMIDFMSDEIFQAIQKKLQEFLSKVDEMFYVTVDVNHKFDFQTNASKTISEIHSGISQEIKSRTSRALKFIDFMNLFLSFYFITIYFKAFRFHSGYMASMRFKNIFITKKFLKLDQQRLDLGMETVLPLTSYEKKKLIQMTSMKLARYEWRHIFKSSLFMLFSTLHLFGISMADYSLFWIMTIIRYYGNRSAAMASTNVNESDVDLLSVHVSGNGIIAEFCKELVGIMEPLAKSNNVDFLDCLPHAEFPNYRSYKIIGLLTIFSWLILLLEPYALRLRGCIMGYYYPQRAEDRVVWLYNEIIRKRTGFMKYARQQLKGMAEDNKKSPTTLFQVLKSNLRRFWIFRKILGDNNYLSCLLCGRTNKKNDDLIRCESGGCPGIYCFDCFSDLRDVCPLCQNMFNYIESSDIDEEQGSSDEEEEEDTSPVAKLLKN